MRFLKSHDLSANQIQVLKSININYHIQNVIYIYSFVVFKLLQLNKYKLLVS